MKRKKEGIGKEGKRSLLCKKGVGCSCYGASVFLFLFFLPLVSNRQVMSVILALFIPHRILALIRFSILFDLL